MADGRAVVAGSPGTCLPLIQGKVSKLQLTELLNFLENKNSLIPSCTGARVHIVNRCELQLQLLAECARL